MTKQGNQPDNIHEMVNLIAEAMLGDSRVEIDKHAMTQALDADLGNNGIRRLSSEEIDELVMGEDLDGSSELEKLYPNVCKELNSYF